MAIMEEASQPGISPRCNLIVSVVVAAWRSEARLMMRPSVDT
jgi:hypothetical protein